MLGLAAVECWSLVDFFSKVCISEKENICASLIYEVKINLFQLKDKPDLASKSINYQPQPFSSSSSEHIHPNPKCNVCCVSLCNRPPCHCRQNSLPPPQLSLPPLRRRSFSLFPKLLTAVASMSMQLHSSQCKQ